MAESKAERGTQARSWQEASRLARQRGYGERVVLPKSEASTLPREFERSTLSIQGAALAVYRDRRPTDSFQVREYEDAWTIQIDRHNPDRGNPLAHAVADAPALTIIFLGAISAVLGTRGGDRSQASGDSGLVG